MINAAINANKFGTVMMINAYLNPFLCVKPVKANRDKIAPACGKPVKTADAIAEIRCIASGLTPIAK